MAFDGAFLHKIVTELNTAADAHIDKIYQPSKDEMVFLLRKKGFAKRLLINTRQGASRLHFTNNSPENPPSPPMFCMLIRKYLSAARFIRAYQPGLERVAVLEFSATNEMGDRVILNLYCEFIGNKTNIVLVNEQNKIIDCLKHSDPSLEGRLLLPGAVYELPQSLNKLNPLKNSIDTIIEAIECRGENIVKSLLNTVDGFSPLICREISEKAEKTSIKKALTGVLEDLKGYGTPTLILKEDSTPFDYSFTEIGQYGSAVKIKIAENYSALLDEFYSNLDTAERIRRSTADIVKLICNLKTRTEKKLALRLEELKKCENREELRIYGELLKANFYLIENGASFAEVPNYYDDMKPIRIPLISSLSPQKNAAKYFKDYKKTYTAEQTLTQLTQKDREELIYFDSVLDSISRCSTTADIGEIREELALAGYIKQSNSPRKKSSLSMQFKEFTSEEGYKIIVGKNNKQNDYITTKLAAKNDLWFHVKNIAGSHVVVFCGGKEVSDNTISFAASLAAQNSKAANSSQVPVDYTPIKFVKKPNGAKPGMVIYTTNKTVYISPNK